MPPIPTGATGGIEWGYVVGTGWLLRFSGAASKRDWAGAGSAVDVDVDAGQKWM